MEGYSRKDDEVSPPHQLLDFIPEWVVNVKREEETSSSYGLSDEKKLELKLGPPADQDWTIKPGPKNNSKERNDQSLLTLGYFPNMTPKTIEDGWIMNNNNGGQSQKLSSSPWPCTGYQVKTQRQQQQTTKAPFLGLHSTPQRGLSVMAKESSQPCCSKGVTDLQNAENKSFSPATANTAVPNNSQKRSAPTVVGWPPIRSFRKNLASSSSSKPPPSQKVVPNEFASEKEIETFRKGWLVKINMDGVPIGRKVDLKACDSYEKLCSSVDELFRGLLAAAQSDSSAGGTHNKPEGEKIITGLLDGSGEYTLVYEDTEGDRMLVGDVPWHMFVSTVKRLRVLKSSELPTLCLGSSKQEKLRSKSPLE